MPAKKNRKKGKPRASGASAPRPRGRSGRSRATPKYGGTMSVVQQSAPVSIGAVVRSAVLTSFGQAPWNDSADCYGLRLEFKVPYSSILGQTTGNGAFGGTSATSASATTYQLVTPTIAMSVAGAGFPTPFVNIPQAFQMYRFRKLIFEYVTEDATSDTGTFVLAYSPDGDAFSTQGGTSGQNREFLRSVEFPVWASNVQLSAIEDKDMMSKDSKLFYCQAGTTTVDANLRIAVQGNVFCSPTLNYGSVAQKGMLYACGIVDLYQQATASQVGLFSKCDCARKELKAKRDEPLPVAAMPRVLAVSSDSLSLQEYPRAMRAMTEEKSAPADRTWSERDDFEVIRRPSVRSTAASLQSPSSVR